MRNEKSLENTIRKHNSFKEKPIFDKLLEKEVKLYLLLKINPETNSYKYKKNKKELKKIKKEIKKNFSKKN